MTKTRENFNNKRKFFDNSSILKMMLWGKGLSNIIRSNKEKELLNWRNKLNYNKNKNKTRKNKVINQKNKKNKNNNLKVKINLMIKTKNQILLLSITTIKTLKESEKYVNMMKRYSNYQRRRVIFRNKEIK